MSRAEVETVQPATLEFLRWVAARRRTYAETMEAWQTSCPRLSVWEDSIIGGLVWIDGPNGSGRSVVSLTARGRAIAGL